MYRQIFVLCPTWPSPRLVCPKHSYKKSLLDLKIRKNHVFVTNFCEFWKKSNFQAEKSTFKFFWKSFDNDSEWFVGCFPTQNTLRYHPRPITIDMEQFYEKKIQLFWNFFLAWSPKLFEVFQFFQDRRWTKISFFSKSKPLDENRFDRNFIHVILDLSLAWFGLNTHREKAYWIWKFVKISLFRGRSRGRPWRGSAKH